VDVAHAGFRSAEEAIDQWAMSYREAFETGSSPDPVMRAYLDTAIKFAIPMDTMIPYFRAMRQDLTINRFPTFSDLLRYMEGSAIPVGRAMTYILGVREPHRMEDALHGADALSIAMQLSNFWRDIGHDWTIGRVYIPQEDLEMFHYSELDLAEQRINTNLVSLLEFQFERTERFYQISREKVNLLDSGRWAVFCALEIYQSILDSIRRNRYDVFTRRAGTSGIQKFRLALKSSFHTIRL
jgi:phytoene synthase